MSTYPSGTGGTIDAPSEVVMGNNGAFVDVTSMAQDGYVIIGTPGGSYQGQEAYGPNGAWNDTTRELTYFFDSPGTYTVSLGVMNSATGEVSTINQQVTVYPNNVAAPPPGGGDGCGNCNYDECGSNENCTYCGSNCENCGSNCDYCNYNSRPRARFTLSKTTCYTTEPVYVTNNSYDPDDNRLTYTWAFNPNTNISIKNSTVVATVEGLYAITLVASDGSKTGSATHQLTVIPHTPVVNFTIPEKIRADKTLIISDSTTDPYDTFKEEWSTSPSTGVQIDQTAKTIKFKDPGTYSVTCKATDLAGYVATKSIDILVEPAVDPPVSMYPIAEGVTYSSSPKLVLDVKNIEPGVESITDIRIKMWTMRTSISADAGSTLYEEGAPYATLQYGTAYATDPDNDVDIKSGFYYEFYVFNASDAEGIIYPTLPVTADSTKAIIIAPGIFKTGMWYWRAYSKNSGHWSNGGEVRKLYIESKPSYPADSIEVEDIEYARNCIGKQTISYTGYSSQVVLKTPHPEMPPLTLEGYNRIINQYGTVAYQRLVPLLPTDIADSRIVWSPCESFNSTVAKYYINELRNNVQAIADIYTRLVPSYAQSLEWQEFNMSPDLECMTDVIDNLGLV
jgi:hypothetical protein